MPELPDVSLYCEALEKRIVGASLSRVRLKSAFLLRTFAPPLGAAEGRRVAGVSRMGKRIVTSLEGELHLVLHLMIAGRLHWKEEAPILKGRNELASFDYSTGSLTLTEAGSKKRASLHLVEGSAGLAAFDRGGVDVFRASPADFAATLRRENRTLARAMKDPRIVDGIGNAYCDEILHRARLSPVQLTSRMDDEQLGRLQDAAKVVLAEWTSRLREENGEGFPEGVTAFRKGMAVHGRFREPCPDCRSPVQRIVHAENESNYCARCQTGGKLLADRALSRLLKQDWPKRIDELER